MKHFCTILFVCTVFSSLWSQTYQGSLTLSTQAQVDAFAYTKIAGDLTIRGPISDLSPLLGLEEADNLYIQLSLLTSLDGLDSLKRLTGIVPSLWIDSNEELADISALAGLTELGQIRVKNNPKLTSLTGLDNVQDSVRGFVIVEENATLQNIQSLGRITETRNLIIANNPQLVSLDGLQHFQQVENLSLKENSGLTNLDSLHRLAIIKQQLILENNPQLVEIDGLSNVQFIGRRIEITNNDKLENLDGLSSLQTIPEPNAVLLIEGNESLVHVEGLSQFVGTLDQLEITHNPSLLHLDGLAGLDSLRIQLYIWDNPALTQINGLRGLRYVPRFVLAKNPALVNLDSLQEVSVSLALELSGIGVRSIEGFLGTTQLENLEIIENPNLEQMPGLANLDQISSSLLLSNNPRLQALGMKPMGRIEFVTISGCHGLQDLAGLEQLSRIDWIGLSNNQGLRSLNGLSALVACDALTINQNDQLTDLTGLASLDTITRNLRIEENASLENLDGLSLQSEVLERLDIVENPKLVSFDALQTLTQVGRSFTGRPGLVITDNAALEDLDGLAGLTGTNVSGIEIMRNAQLTDVSGLLGLEDVAYGMNLSENPRLTECCILFPLIEKHGRFTGKFSINDNGAGCSLAEIWALGPCGNPLPPELAVNSFFPNPATDHLIFSSQSPENRTLIVQLTDLQGRLVWESEEIPILAGNATFQVALPQLTSGLYLLRFPGEPQIAAQKLWLHTR